VAAINDDRKKRMAQKIISACGGTVQDWTIAVLGLTFKPNTDDMREAPSLDVIPALQAAGAVIRAFDPEGMARAREALSGVQWCGNAYEAMSGADAVVVLTEWNEFRAIDPIRMRDLLKRPLVIDLRNIYLPEIMADAGFEYTSVGRPTVPASPPGTASDRKSIARGS
jgi:UDPglucose 6-dehydrogenase